MRRYRPLSFDALETKMLRDGGIGVSPMDPTNTLPTASMITPVAPPFYVGQGVVVYLDSGGNPIVIPDNQGLTNPAFMAAIIANTNDPKAPVPQPPFPPPPLPTSPPPAPFSGVAYLDPNGNPHVAFPNGVSIAVISTLTWNPATGTWMYQGVFQVDPTPATPSGSFTGAGNPGLV